VDQRQSQHWRRDQAWPHTNPLSPPAAPVQGRLQGPPAKSKFLAVDWDLAEIAPEDDTYVTNADALEHHELSLSVTKTINNAGQVTTTQSPDQNPPGVQWLTANLTQVSDESHPEGNEEKTEGSDTWTVVGKGAEVNGVWSIELVFWKKYGAGGVVYGWDD